MRLSLRHRRLGRARRAKKRRREKRENRIKERNEVRGLRKVRKKKIDDDRENRESGKVRYRTRTSRVRLLVVMHFVEEGLGEARLAVWVMYWHMYVIVAICLESETPKETQIDGER